MAQPALVPTPNGQPATENADPSQDRFRTVFENSPFGQKIIDPDLIIRQANPAALALLNLTHPEELLGHTIIEFAHPDFRADWQRLQKELWEHKTPYFQLETCLIRAGGTSFWCQVTSIRFPDEGGELGFTVLEDISERKKTEDSRQRLYDAQETIMHLVAHDIRNPLATIQLVTDLLEREANDPGAVAAHSPASDAQQYFALIRRACAEAEELLEDVVYLGALDPNELNKQPTDLSALLTALLGPHYLAAREKGIALTLDLPPEAISVALHPDKFGRVVTNLLANALKFTPAGGRVVVDVRRHEDRVWLRVRDTGIGIPAGLQAQVFDKFNPTRRRGLRGEPATGLGLFIARQIVMLHGGRIWLESHKQQGTTFFVELE